MLNVFVLTLTINTLNAVVKKIHKCLRKWSQSMCYSKCAVDVKIFLDAAQCLSCVLISITKFCGFEALLEKCFLCLQLINDVKIKFILSSLIRGNSSSSTDLMENVDWISFSSFFLIDFMPRYEDSYFWGFLYFCQLFLHEKSFHLFFVNLNSVFNFLTFFFFLRKLALVKFCWQLYWEYYRVRHVAA